MRIFERISARTVWISVAVVAIIAVILSAVVYFTPAFSVRQYEVEGNKHVTTEQVIEATNVAEGQILAQVNVEQAARQVVALPWVRTVTVKRGWPSSLKVEVTEHEAVAFTREGDGPHLLNQAGSEFAIEEPPQEAVEITGSARGDEAARISAVEIASSISTETRTQISAIEAEGPYRFIVALNDGRQVVWGASEDNHDKALALDTVLGREGQEFDISNPSQIGVR
ncbi:cell division protein FtsQ/DivIB [Corynebacterium lubricantis]|uniref:cell division protein FtsQ/DivIB n=1 Tax=Corynebacterium lubricantis TaxID=541095 RepID=UPI00037B73C5|nr:FtsQ-type POTRA domain-containing protein [Corynebacterium lubricantis]